MNLDKIFFLKKPLRKVMDGHLFDIVFGWVLRIAAFLMVVTFVFKSIDIWQKIFYFQGMRIEPSARAVFSTIIAQLVWICIYFGFSNVLWIRGSDILTEENDPDYNATPNLVLIVKAIGECYAIFILGAFAIDGISTWLGYKATNIVNITNFLRLGWLMPLVPKNGFLFGLTILAAGPVLAILCVLCVYTVAEVMGSLVSIARNTEKKK